MKLTRSYTSAHEVLGDGSVRFDCSRDEGEWPWLALGPRHPVVVQAQNFWCSVGGIMALGGLAQGQWSALTWTAWTCGEPGVDTASHGLYRREKDGGKESFHITLFDARQREVVSISGRGVVFRNRDFEQWREGSKRAAASAQAGEDFVFAPRDALGLGEREHPLVGLPRVAADSGPESVGESVPVLVSRANALPPANPMLGGSGDHVNTVHMIEAARQALCLLRGETVTAHSGGEMALDRYVELGTPFDLRATGQSSEDAVLVLRQLDRDCARITLRV